MPIELDAPGDKPTIGDLSVVALRDAMALAEGSVTHWNEELRARVKELSALDGVFTLVVSTLAGTREQRLDKATAAVREAQGRLAASRRALDEARDALEKGQHQRRVAEGDEMAREEALEAAALRLQGSSHPSSEELTRLDVALLQAEMELEGIKEAVTSGSALAAFLGVMVREHENAEIEPWVRSSMGWARRGGESLPSLQGTLQQLTTRVLRFEAACEQVGVPLQMKHREATATSPLVQMVRMSGQAWSGPVAASMRAMELYGVIRAAKDEADLMVPPFRDRAVVLQENIAEIRRQRTALLASTL